MLHHLYDTMNTFEINAIIRYNESGLPSKAQLDEHCEEFDEIFDDLAKRSPMVFGHLDVQSTNIIYDSKTGQVSFLFMCIILCITLSKPKV